MWQYIRSNMKCYKGRSGIYKITNKINGKIYIGKTKDFYKRYYQYVSDVRNFNNNRINQHLMNSFLKYGFENFDFTVVEFCDIEQCAAREEFWILEIGCLNREVGYNLRLDTSTGMLTHPDTSIKISDNLKQQWCDGKRDGHSAKLKKSWEFRDRSLQSSLLSNTLTKYFYVVIFPDNSTDVLLYKDLVRHELNGVISKFHRKKCDIVDFKSHTIERCSDED